MPKLVDRTGQFFGRLKALKQLPNQGKATQWLCLCECGKITKVFTCSLTSGHTKSCGCYGNEQRLRATIKHSKCASPEYRSWDSMIQRCTNKNNKAYPNYGGRGITVWAEWFDFRNFLRDMGERPKNTTIDRIDNNGNYEPSNCRWATWSQQMSNRRPYTRRHRING